MEGGLTEKQQSSSSGSSYTYWVRESKEDAAPLPVPRKLSAEDLSKQQSSQPSSALGSVWNQAGTWEEKNLNSWASSRIKELLTSMGTLEFANGKADIHEVSKCTGDAFLVTVRNKKRVGYTYEVSLKFKGEWMIQGESKKTKGHVDIHEFTYGELDDLQMEVRLSKDKDLMTDHKTGIIKDMKTVLPAIREKLLKFEEELRDSGTRRKGVVNILLTLLDMFFVSKLLAKRRGEPFLTRQLTS